MDILNKDDKQILFQQYTKILKDISIYANKSNKKNRHHFIRPLRKAEMSLKDVRKIGFNCSFNLWKSCLNEHDRNLGGRPVVRNDLLMELNDHTKDISDISANRTYISRQFNQRIPTIVYKRKTISKS